MKGLLVKDFKLLLQRSKYFAIVAVCGIVMSFSMDSTFFIGWIIMILSLFSLSTIAYDEYDNGMPFLMTLPIDRKTYALEKYVFGYITACIGWLFAIAVTIITSLITGKANSELLAIVVNNITVLIVPLVILSFSIPAHLKYGAEKGRMVILLAGGISFMAIYALLTISPVASQTIETIDNTSSIIVVIVSFAIACLISAISIKLSGKIMENKEF